MVAAISTRMTREALLAELTCAGLKTAARHGVRGPSVDLEIELWNALAEVLHREASPFTTPAMRWDDCLARWTEAAYRVVLAHGFAGSFVDLEMELWQRFHRKVRTHRFLDEQQVSGPVTHRAIGMNRAVLA